jgi:hypothetical protein
MVIGGEEPPRPALGEIAVREQVAPGGVESRTLSTSTMLPRSELVRLSATGRRNSQGPARSARCLNVASLCSHVVPAAWIGKLIHLAPERYWMLFSHRATLTCVFACALRRSSESV